MYFDPQKVLRNIPISSLSAFSMGCSINKKNVPFNSQINVSTSKFDANSVTLGINIVDMFDTEAAQSQYQTTLTNSAKTLDVTAYYTAATGETVYV